MNDDNLPPWEAKEDGEDRGVRSANLQSATWVAVDYAPSLYGAAPATAAAVNYPAHRNSMAMPPVSSASSSSGPTPSSGDANPYVHVSSVAATSPMETILKVLGRCGRKLEERTRKAGDLAGNVWTHLKTSPRPADAAMARLAQGTKTLAEGGHDKVFHQIFGTYPGEELRKAYACYLSTSSGPVIGTLYISTARISFCSDNPICHNTSQGQQEWIYYKVIVHLNQLRAVNPSANPWNPAEKYIQIVTMDNHEFWFMGFVSYEKALKNLREALQHFHDHA